MSSKRLLSKTFLLGSWHQRGWPREGKPPPSPSPTSSQRHPAPHPTDNILPWWLNHGTRKLLMLRRLMELILPVEQQVYGATPDPTPTLGPPSPQYNVEILARGWGGKIWNKYCHSTLYWGEGGSSCTKHPNDVSIISYTKI